MKPREIEPSRSITIRFDAQEDVDKFAKLMNQKIMPNTDSIWYPEMTLERYTRRRYDKNFVK